MRKESQRLSRGSAKQSREELVAGLNEAAGQLPEWEAQRAPASVSSAGGAGLAPTVPAEFFALNEFLDECAKRLDALRGYVGLDASATVEQLSALTADQDTAWKLPRLYELAARLDGQPPLYDNAGPTLS